MLITKIIAAQNEEEPSYNTVLALVVIFAVTARIKQYIFHNILNSATNVSNLLFS